MVSATLKVSHDKVKKGKETAGTRRPAQVQSSGKSSLSGTDVTELKNVKRVTGAKDIGSGTFGTCYPGTFREYRVVIKEYKSRNNADDEHHTLELLKREARKEARAKTARRPPGHTLAIRCMHRKNACKHCPQVSW